MLERGMYTWNERQYGSWTYFGVASTISCVYWLQQYYYKYKLAAPKEYACTGKGSSFCIDSYAIWNLAELVNTVMLMVQWVPTALVWVISTATNTDELIWFFVTWAGIIHYIDAARFLTVSVLQMVSYFVDHSTDHLSYEGTSQTYKVSKTHKLDMWDFLMKWFAFMVSYGYYKDLNSIIAEEDDIFTQGEAPEGDGGVDIDIDIEDVEIEED